MTAVSGSGGEAGAGRSERGRARMEAVGRVSGRESLVHLAENGE